MADFLAKARKRPTETLELLGETIEVRGLGMGELVELTRVKKGEPAKDNLHLTCELLLRCCFNKKDGKPLFTPEQLDALPEMGPAVYNTLNDAIGRVNGSEAGNSKATDGGD